MTEHSQPRTQRHGTQRPAGGADPWAGLVERFVDRHYGSVHGKVRTYVVDRQLAAHLDPPPAPIVDVGGGAGTQALPLARRGHPVTIIEPSPAMLARARQALEHEPEDVAGRVRLMEARGERALDIVDAGTFSGVLCHGVIPYLDDPRDVIAALCALARPGGIVSILAKTAGTLAVRPAVDGRWDDALKAFDADHEVNALGLHTRTDSVDGLTALLREHDVQQEAWYGVRLFVDGWTADRRLEPGELPKVLEVEFEAARRDPYRQLSRLFHLIGRKTPGP
jgi:SAM-dependent methyltransferase